jgi:hypothetical protein
VANAAAMNPLWIAGGILLAALVLITLYGMSGGDGPSSGDYSGGAGHIGDAAFGSAVVAAVICATV